MHNPNNNEFVLSTMRKALATIANSGASNVGQIRFVLGELAEVDPDEIRSQWLELSRGTPAERAQLHFHLITAEVQCMSCFQKYHPEGGRIHCPYCGSFGAKILAGEEFYVESMD
jgi:hydrogenase nickel incorporation protein HypA/HybF